MTRPQPPKIESTESDPQGLFVLADRVSEHAPVVQPTGPATPTWQRFHLFGPIMLFAGVVLFGALLGGAMVYSAREWRRESRAQEARPSGASGASVVQVTVQVELRQLVPATE